MATNSAMSGAASGAAAGSVFGPWGTVIGGAVGLLGGMFDKQKAPKKVPFEPDWEPLDLQAEQKKAVDGNLANADSIEQLVTRSNRYAQGQANSLMEQAVPGFADLSKKFLALASTNVSDPYSLPADVSSNLTRIAAERGINTGVRGQAGQFSLLRDLGVNMLEYGNARINQAQNLLQTIVSLTPRVSPMSPLSFYVTPQQQAAVAGQNSSTRLDISKYKQAIDQGGENAITAAENWNTRNMWDSLATAGGMAGGYLDATRTPPAKTT